MSQHYIELANAITALANTKNITPSQLAIAWVISKGILPIPGTKRAKYVEQNITAASIILTENELQELETIVPLGTVIGDRYDAASMAGIDK